MSMLTLGMSEEFKNYGISVNSLWPQTMIATAAHVILSSANRSVTGRLLIDEQVLRESGITEFNHYRFNTDSDDTLMPDLFID